MDYEHIVGATDFSDLGDIALRRACELAVAAGARPSPLLAHFEVSVDVPRRERAIALAREALEERMPEAVREAGLEVTIEVHCGDPSEELLALDLRATPDLIVLATHGHRGWERWILGSVAERVVRLARADVLAVRERLGE